MDCLKRVLGVLGLILLLGATALGQATPKTDLTGLWSNSIMNGSRKITTGFRIIQNGKSVTVTLNQPGMPHFVAFEGKFSGDNIIAGRARGPSSNPNNPNWVPETMTVMDASHLKSSSGMALERVGGSGRGAQGRRCESSRPT